MPQLGTIRLFEDWKDNPDKMYTVFMNGDPRHAERATNGFIPTPYGIVGIRTIEGETQYYMTLHGRNYWGIYEARSTKRTVEIARLFAESAETDPSTDDFVCIDLHSKGAL